MSVQFSVLEIDFIKPVPNLNDELIRYKIDIAIDESKFNYEWILNGLQSEGFEKGLTIKNIFGEIIYADELTADIKYKRSLRKK